jgi:hypothetical protein
MSNNYQFRLYNGEDTPNQVRQPQHDALVIPTLVNFPPKLVPKIIHNPGDTPMVSLSPGRKSGNE